MLLIKHPNLRKLQTVPPMFPSGFSINFQQPKQGAQVVQHMEKHSAKRELGTVPPRELETVPLLGGHFWTPNGTENTLRWYSF